jgi:carbohydrate-selective porin OprB
MPYGTSRSGTALEHNFSYQVAQCWVVQGDLQYVRNTRARRVEPNSSARTISNSVVVEVRTDITF